MLLEKKQSLTVFLLLLTVTLFAQNIKPLQGDLISLSGVERYNIVFEYAEDLKIPHHVSEEAFLEFQTRKKEEKETGSGEAFRNRWYTSRAEQFEPKFIQEFNYFNLKEKQVTVARDITDAKYTMVIKTLLIELGNSNFFFKKNASLEIEVRIYENNNPETILFSTENIDIHSRGANSDDYNRVMSAYAELGKALAKYLSRKT